MWREHDIVEAQKDPQTNGPKTYADRLVAEWKNADELGKKIIEERLEWLMHNTSSDSKIHFYHALYVDIADAKLKLMQAR